MRPTPKRSIRPYAVAATLLTVTALAGCGSGRPVTYGPASASGSPAADGSSASGSPAGGGSASEASGEVPAEVAGVGTPAAGRNGTMGYGRDLPAVPPIVVPDVSAFDKSSAAFTAPFKTLVNPIKGVSVSGARCDATGRIVNGASLTAVDNGDGSGTYDDPSKRVVNNGDGSGSYDDASSRIVVNGDGSGSYDDASSRIVINKDGSGSYDDAPTRTVINKDGSGSYDDPTTRVVVNGDGSGSYDDATVRLVNAGDGSGSYDDASIRVVNNGDGTGHVSGPTWEADVPMDPLPPLPPVATFPPVKSIKPVGKACGVLIRLSDQVLFDFDKATLRPGAAPLLDGIAAALKDARGTVRVDGHTDSLGSDAYNADLSTRRARAVADALSSHEVGARFQVTGFGEKRPVAPNTFAGKDFPGGRQLNRRVEIVVPSVR